MFLCDNQDRINTVSLNPVENCVLNSILIHTHLPLNWKWLHGIASVIFFRSGWTGIVHDAVLVYRFLGLTGRVVGCKGGIL